eukprot:16445828-Heterocapsa_arctica.AAC.1
MGVSGLLRRPRGLKRSPGCWGSRRGRTSRWCSSSSSSALCTLTRVPGGSAQGGEDHVASAGCVKLHCASVDVSP